MVRRIVLLLLCWSGLASASLAAAGLTASVDRQQIEFGKSLILTLSSKQSGVILESVDLELLHDQFVIEPLNHRLVDKNGMQQRQWRLYPRQPGRLTIPALRAGYVESDPLSIEVTSAIDPRDRQPVDVTFSVSSESVRLREAVYIHMTLETGSPIVVLEQAPVMQEGLTIEKMQSRHTPSGNDRQRYRHHTGWVVIPRRDGKTRLQLPAVQFVRDGITTHRFYPPRLELDVRSLPHYLPPGIPVGRLSMHIPDTYWFVFTSELEYLTLNLTGHDMGQQDLPVLERQLASSEALSLYPVRRTVQQTTAGGNLTSQADYEIPFRVNSIGHVTLPELRLDYFDPEQGKLLTQKVAGIEFYAINKTIFYLVAGGFLIGLWRLGNRIWPAIGKLVSRWRTYSRVLDDLPNTPSGNGLLMLLRDIAVAEGWSANITPSQWRQRWQQLHHEDRELDRAIEKLIRYCYAAQPADITAIGNMIEQAIGRSMPILYAVNRLKRLLLRRS